MRLRSLGTLAGLVLGSTALPAPAQTSYPMVTRVEPTVVRQGETVTIVVAGGGSFAGATALLFEGPGLAATVLDSDAKEQPKGRNRATGSVKAELTVAHDAPLGPRELRVATPQGISSIGQVVVVADPVAVEADDKANDRPDTAQPITLPVAISGTIGKVEDVDWYRLEAGSGQTVVFTIWGNRLQNKIHDLQTHLDPILQLHDAQGRELAANDNHHFADPALTHTFREAGTYYLQVRDTTYAGNANWTYVLQVTSGPVVSSVFPLAVNPGRTATLAANGVNFDRAKPIGLDVPETSRPGPGLFTLPTDAGASLPVPLVVTPLPLLSEQDDAPEAPETAQPLGLPVALSGRLGEANDLDSYRFEAKKDALYSFEVVARRAGAAIDPILRIVDAKGKMMVEVDDTFGKDPRIEWKAPADGVYAVRLGDLHSRGGEAYGYVLLAEPARPDFVVKTDPDKLNLGPGARTPLFVKVERRGGFAGPVVCRLEGLPPGVTASPLTIPATMTQGLIVVAAAADAKPAAGPIRLFGEAESADGSLIREATPTQEIYMPGGGRSVYPVATMVLGVTDPSDITVEATPDRITLEPGGTVTLDVTVTRSAGYDKAVNLAILLSHLGGVHGNPLPPGVKVREAGSKTLLSAKETRGTIVLEAAADAPPCTDVPIAVMGHVSINFVVKTAYCTAPLLVTVPPRK